MAPFAARVLGMWWCSGSIDKKDPQQAGSPKLLILLSSPSLPSFNRSTTDRLTESDSATNALPLPRQLESLLEVGVVRHASGALLEGRVGRYDDEQEEARAMMRL